MDKGNCTGLHPYGPCAPGEGCNRERCGVFEMGSPCGDEGAPGWDMCRYHLRQHVADLRARVAEARAELGLLDADFAESEAEVTSLRVRVAELEAELHDIKTLRARVAEVAGCANCADAVR